MTATAPGHCGEPFALLILLHLGPSYEADAVFPPHFTDGETEAQQGSGRDGI